MEKVLEKVGFYCTKGKELKVLKSPAGYYVGTFDEDGPYCRITGYASKPDDPSLNIERDCAENQFCNGNSLCGCKISIAECRKHGIAYPKPSNKED